MPQRPAGPRRADAERNRAAIVDAALRQLARGDAIDMQRLAADAGVSRSTLYRRFAGADAVRAAIVERALREAGDGLRAALSSDAPALALLRRAVTVLTSVGARYPLAQIRAASLAGLERLGRELVPLAARIAALAEIEPVPPRGLLRTGMVHLIEISMEAGTRSRDPAAAADALFAALTEQLDQGLVALERPGRLVTLNKLAAEALAVEAPKPGRRLTAPLTGSVYEDGSPCPSDAYPLARAVTSGVSERATIRGHRGRDGTLRWFDVSAIALTRLGADSPYAIVGVFSEVTEEKRAELVQLQPPGRLGRARPVPLDVVRVLDEIPPQLLPEQIVAEARRLVHVPVALYVVDIDGSRLLCLAGSGDFPSTLAAPLALGPELAENGLTELRARIARRLPEAVMAPMWLRGRAVGVLLALGGRESTLTDIARLAAPAIELANGYTDVLDAARRRKDINPAAEIQQSLLAPRIARLGSGEIAAGMLPSYEVGGDWFDYVENRDGAWIAIADAAGRGPRAGALGGIGLAALRAARRNEASLEAAVRTMHRTICDAGEDEFFLTAVVARWDAPHSVLSWIRAGHPPPLLLAADGKLEELASESTLPLGLGALSRSFRRTYRKLSADDRVILYTDGISARATRTGFFGKDGIARAALGARSRSAPELARSIQEAVATASTEPLRDDAAVIVLSPRK